MPTNVWSEPIYYAYGPNGNVQFENGNVLMNGEKIASQQQFAESAAVLATVPPPENEEIAEEAEWMPLGTFALSTNEKELEPTRIMQLAVSRDGIITGSLYNTLTDSSQILQGSVDPDTQRVAFKVGQSGKAIMETGLFNLTQDETPVLVHFENEKTETYLLVRLEAPEGEGESEDRVDSTELDAIFGPSK